MDDLLEIFSNNLNHLMKSRGENIKDLSLKINTPYTTVSNWVRGNKMARSGGLQALSKHYHVPISYLTTEHKKDEIKQESYEYNFFDVGLSAGKQTTIDPFTEDDVQKISISDVLMGKYARCKDLFFTYVNGESMNKILQNHSLIAIKKYNSIHELKDGDIVAFKDGEEICLKQFHNDYRSKIYVFHPQSTEDTFKPIVFRWEDADELRIIGKVVISLNFL